MKRFLLFAALALWFTCSAHAEPPAARPCEVTPPQSTLTLPQSTLAGCQCGPNCPAGGGCDPCLCAEPRNPGTELVRVSRPIGGGVAYSGSGTVIACEDGKSLVLTNNHIFADQPHPKALFPRAPYPMDAEVISRDGKTRYKGKAIDGVGSTAGDLALVVVDAVLPAAELAPCDPAVGVKVWHMGVGSGRWHWGAVCPCPPSLGGPAHQFASTTPSVSGDSGAGVFDEAGNLVAVNCGRHGMELSAPQRGVPVSAIRHFLRQRVRGLFPRLAARVGAETAEPPLADSQQERYVAAVGGLRLGESCRVFVNADPGSAAGAVRWDGYPGVAGRHVVTVTMYTNGPHESGRRNLDAPPPAPQMPVSAPVGGNCANGNCRRR